MNCIFYENKSDSRVVNKNLVEVTQKEILLKNENDLINPTIFLKNSELDSNINYLYIERLNRYYFINSKNLGVGNTLSLNCHVDVLQSHKDKILELVPTIARNENQANGYLIDSQYKSLAYNEIVCKSFPQGLTSDSLILMTVG